jgi:Transcriptional activator of glycolytic enzymes
MQPTRMANPEQIDQNQFVAAVANLPAAELSKNPRSLHNLWTEYHYSIGGLKAEKNITPSKKTYSRRKVIWDTIDRLIRTCPNYNSLLAIDAILEVYGHSEAITKIIDGIVSDRKRGMHPNLH